MRSAAQIEAAEANGMMARERREELSADEVAAEHEEEVDADPAEAMYLPRESESKNSAVIKDDNDDRERAQEIETGLAFSLNETRVEFAHRC